MKTKAAVVREFYSLTIEDVLLDPPGPGEVLVRIRAAGVCHSDLHTYRGELRTTPPLVLGHEGAGVVVEVGAGVTKVKAGDAILVNWIPACGVCMTCLSGTPNLCERLGETTFKGWLPDGSSRLRTQDGIQLKHYLSSATMSEYAVLHEAGVIPIPKDVPFEIAAIIGCAVATGVGAVINTARARAGSSAAVIGCGGIGLSAILGCILAGCNPVIAVDIADSKLAFARGVGATATLNSKETDLVDGLRSLTRRGPDYVFDSVGSAATIPLALKAAAPGGVAVIMGLHAAKVDVPIAAGVLVLQNKSLLGSFVGSIRPQVDLPKLVSLYRSGRLPLEKLITKRYSLDGLPDAFADMEAATIARAVITFDD